MHVIKRNLGRKARLLLQIIEHFVEQDQALYVDLMEQCVTVVSEVRAVAQGRETREENESSEGGEQSPETV